MDVKGQITIFPKLRGKFKFFECTIANKDDKGNYINASMECKFGNAKLFPKEFIDSLEVGKYYQLDVKTGFLSVDAWEDKITHATKRKVVIIITNGNVGKSGTIEKSAK